MFVFSETYCCRFVALFLYMVRIPRCPQSDHGERVAVTGICLTPWLVPNGEHQVQPGALAHRPKRPCFVHGTAGRVIKVALLMRWSRVRAPRPNHLTPLEPIS